MILPVRLYTDQILKIACKQVMDFNGPELEILIQNMIESCIANNGVGLAANQVGSDKQVAVIRVESRTKTMIVINPKVVAYSKKKATQVEACLSCPGLSVNMKRPESVVVDMNLPTGELVRYQFDGYDCRIFMHEHDHLMGVTIASSVKSYLPML